MRAVDPKARKAQLQARIRAQREVRAVRRAATQLAREAGAGDRPSGASAFAGMGAGAMSSASGIARQVMAFAKKNPLAAAGVASVVMMFGPRRLLRMAAWVLPLVLRR